jgi:hypothetical protein
MQAEKRAVSGKKGIANRAQEVYIQRISLDPPAKGETS